MKTFQGFLHDLIGYNGSRSKRQFQCSFKGL